MNLDRETTTVMDNGEFSEIEEEARDHPGYIVGTEDQE